MKTIIYFRKADDTSLIRYKLVLDDNQCLISDEPYEVTENDQADILVKFPHLADQIDGGALFEIQPDGSLLAVFIPETQKEAYRFFAGSPVAFDGAEELRTEFEKRKTDLGYPGCMDCSYGKMLREFMPRVLAAINKSNGKFNSNTGTKA